MKYEKINSANMKKNNYKAVLDIVRFSSGISRKSLAKQIGLTGATITNIVSNLIQRGYIREIGEIESSSGGRKEIMLAINPDACYIVGVELSASIINCVLTDFSACVLARRRTKIKDINDDKEGILNAIVDTIQDVIRQSGVQPERIGGIGLSTPGPCDIEKGILINPPNLRCMHHTPIKDIIQERTGIPVLFEHHMNAAALCENWLGLAKSAHCLFLCAILEVGVAGSILIDGKLHHGFMNAAGEIGHMSVDSSGPKCVCGNYGCLEPLAQGRALTDALKKRFLTDTSLLEKYHLSSPEEIDIDFALEQAEAGDPIFREELLRRAAYVGQALCTIISVISPDVIALMGELADKSPTYVDAIAQCVHRRAYPSHTQAVKVYATGFKRDVCALGGVVMVLNSISENL